MTTSAVVLARGLGTRMRSEDAGAALTDAQRQAAEAGHKAMMPIAGRPFLDFLLSHLDDAGLRQVALVVAPDHDALRRYYTREAPPTRLTIDFVVQREPRGTADAVLAAESWTGARPFLVMNSDNLYPVPALAAAAALGGPGLPAFAPDDLVRTGNIEPERVHAFALLETDATSRLTRIVEKPPPEAFRLAGGAALVSMNCWRFDDRIFGACRDVPRSPRGELELPAAVGLSAARGVPYQVVRASGPVLDLSKRADTAEVARRLAGVVPRP